MDQRRVLCAKFSTSPLLHGKEIPVSKSIRPTQVHRDYFPLRAAGNCLVSVSTSPPPARYSPVEGREQTVVRTQLQWRAMPVQLLASFAEVPALRSANVVGKRLEAVPIARAECSTKQVRKLPMFRAEPKSRQMDFEPYTMQDYQRLKPSFSQILGGLGPARVGSEEWTLGVRKLQRIRNFARRLQRSHTMDCPM